LKQAETRLLLDLTMKNTCII